MRERNNESPHTVDEKCKANRQNCRKELSTKMSGFEETTGKVIKCRAAVAWEASKPLGTLLSPSFFSPSIYVSSTVFSIENID